MDESGDKSSTIAPDHFDLLRTGDILDDLGLNRVCCRRVLLTTVDMMDKI